MKIQPTRDIVLIKADPPKDKSDGGILLVENWKTLPLDGEVIAVGPETRAVKPGDRVQFMRYSSVVLENDERLVPEKHIFGVYHD